MIRITTRMCSRSLLICLCLGGTLWPLTPASADLAASKRELGPWAQGLKVGSGMDASGRILRGSKFIGLDFRNAKFDGADLGGAEFYQCDLRNASFKSAILTGLVWGDCNLEGADLADAVLNGVIPIHDISGYGIELTAAQFTSTRSYKTKQLSHCIIRLALNNGAVVAHAFDFRGADLRATVFSCCDLRKSDLRDARIHSVRFDQSWITGKQITSTFEFKDNRSLPGVCFGVVDDAIDLSGCDLSGTSDIPSLANITGATISNCTLRAPLSLAQLQSTKNYKEGRMTGISFQNQDLTGLDLSSQNLTGCRFSDCILTDTNLEDAIITNTSFSRFRKEDLGLTLDQIKSTWNYKHGRMAGIVLPDDIAQALELERKAGGG